MSPSCSSSVFGLLFPILAHPLLFLPFLSLPNLSFAQIKFSILRFSSFLSILLAFLSFQSAVSSFLYLHFCLASLLPSLQYFVLQPWILFSFLCLLSSSHSLLVLSFPSSYSPFSFLSLSTFLPSSLLPILRSATFGPLLSPFSPSFLSLL